MTTKQVEPRGFKFLGATLEMKIKHNLILEKGVNWNSIVGRSLTNWNGGEWKIWLRGMDKILFIYRGTRKTCHSDPSHQNLICVRQWQQTDSHTRWPKKAAILPMISRFASMALKLFDSTFYHFNSSINKKTMFSSCFTTQNCTTHHVYQCHSKFLIMHACIMSAKKEVQRLINYKSQFCG